MRLTIIIVNWNGKEVLKACIASILEHGNGVDVQILVVDNASADGSAEMLRRLFPAVELIESAENLGFGRACNLGAKHARAEFILFLNPDARVGPNSLEQMVQYMESHPDIGGLGCKIIDGAGAVTELGRQRFPTPMGELLKLLFLSGGTVKRWGRLLDRQDPMQSADVRKLYGACLLVRRTVFDAVGGFDERFFMYAEDVDLCRKILDTRHRLFYLASAEIWHGSGALSEKAGGSFSTLMTCESVWKFMIKYHGPSGGFRYKVAVFFGASFRWLSWLIIYACSSLVSRSRLSLCRARLERYAAMLQWSIALRKAFVPGSN